MGLALSSNEVALLERRTEGWIAGLQLAAHSLRLEEDKSSFLMLFAGDDRYIADYLLEEVLAHQPETIQSFLLQTSILDRLCASLCDAMLGRQDSQSVLEFLERSNLFVVPLDNRRRWYRYHHLFADLLRERLAIPDNEKNRLHRHACRWYADNGFTAQAIDHAISATDYEEAIGLILNSAIELFDNNRFATLTNWWRQIPDVMKENNPRACMMAAWAWLAFGRWEESERCLIAVEKALGVSTGALLTIGDTLSEAVRNGLIEIAVIRISRQSVAPADESEILTLCQHILPFLVAGDQPHLFNPPFALRSVVLFNMGLAHEALGDLDAAKIAFSEAIASAELTANVQIVARGSGLLAKIEYIQGRLHQAADTCRRGIELLAKLAGRTSPLGGLLHIQLGQLFYEWNELDLAVKHFQEGIRLAKSWHVRETLLPGYLGLGIACRALADDQGALAAERAFDDIIAGDRQLANSIISANQGWLLSQMADERAARRWSQIAGLQPAPDSLNQPQMIILARQQFLQGELESANRLVIALLEAAESGAQMRSIVELLVLQTTILDAQERRESALRTLSRALGIAASEGYLRTFVDGGEPVARLLRELARSGGSSEYANKVLAAFPPAGLEPRQRVERAPNRPALGPHLSELVDPLSDRELEILQLIAEGLTNKEIATRLYLSPGTVKVHAHNIYSKLAVGGRTQAVARARTLNILP